MFIELTDHLRCPAAHDEAFLVLLPETIVDRQVRIGTLGCPVCNAAYPVKDGVVHFGVPTSPPSSPPSAPPPIAGLAAFLGLGGPGGYVGMVGDVGALARELVGAIRGVHIAVVNAPAGSEGSDRVTLMEAPSIPVKARQLRGVILGSGYGSDEKWIGEGVRVVLPGLRVVGTGTPPERPDLQLLAAADGWWVAVRK
jgi:uncharacterized protein YbaR (Trm112 family)